MTKKLKLEKVQMKLKQKQEIEAKEVILDRDEMVLDPLVVFANLDAALTSEDKLTEYNAVKDFNYFNSINKDNLADTLSLFKKAKVIFISYDSTSIVSIINEKIDTRDKEIYNINMAGASINIRTKNIEEVLYSELSRMIIIKMESSFILLYDDGTDTFM